MTPTDALRKKLRKLLNEVIPDKGTDADTNFSDEEIDTLLQEADSVYAAASAGWLEKAGMLQGEIEGYSVGTEKYDLTSLKDRLQHALTMAQQYSDLASKDNVGSFMIRVRPPRVL